MKYCPNCGKELKEGSTFCANCGTKVKSVSDEINEGAKKVEDKAKELYNNVKDSTKDFSKKDIEDGKLMGIFSYLGLLALIPFFSEKNNKFVRFHAVQGMNLFIIEIIVGIVNFIPFIGWLLDVAVAILSIIGIVNVINGEAKELPVVGSIKIIKE